MTSQAAVAYRCSQQQQRCLQLIRAGVRPLTQATVRIDPSWNVQRLDQKWRQLCASLPVLRTIITEAAEGPLQLVHPEASFVLVERTIRRSRDTAAVLRQASEEELGVMGSDPCQARLLRMSSGESAAYLIITVAGECCDVLSLRRILARLLDGRTEDTEDEIGFLQYSDWQNGILETREGQATRNDWSAQYREGMNALPFMATCEGSPEEAERLAARMPLSRGVAAGIRSMAERLGVESDVVVQAALRGLLARMCGGGDLEVSVELDGRTVSELDSTIGPLAQQVPVAISTDIQLTVESLVRRVGDAIGKARERQEFFDWRDFAAQRHTASPLLSIGIQWQRACEPQARCEQFEVLDARAVAVGCDLTLRMTEGREGIVAEWRYLPGRRELAAVKRIAQQWRSWIRAFVRGAALPIASLEFPDSKERAFILRSFAGCPRAASKEDTVVTLIEAQVRLRPDAAALSGQDGVLTYAMLERHSRFCAGEMLRSGARGVIGIDATFGTNAIVLMLAALRAGLAYIPVDTTQPVERIRRILGLAGEGVPLFTLSDRCALQRTPGIDLRSLTRSGAGAAMVPLSASLLAESLAYIMTTSGSTGVPKGVMVTHRNLLESTSARLSGYRDPVERFLLLSPLYVDSSVAGIFWTLACGGELVLPEEECRHDPGAAYAFSVQKRASHLLCIPSFYSYFVQHAKPDEGSALRVAIVAAEACPLDLLIEHRNRLPGTLLANEYGPSEASVWASVFECRNVGVNRIAIGKAAAHATLYVLDETFSPAAVGGAGEIYIGGPAVARGYAGRPAATAQSFVPNPFSEVPGERLYRTGDFGHWSAAGLLYFIGRVDEQVKVRGYRVELSEIRQALQGCPGVREAWVLHRAAANELVAFAAVGSSRGAHVSTQLREALARLLPVFMVPQRIVLLEALPRLAGGKVDGKRLMELAATVTHALAHDPPTDSLEAVVAKIWEQCLSCPPVSRGDSFFVLGGHSLNAVQVISRVRDSLGIQNATLGLIFQHPVLSEFAGELHKLRAATPVAAAAPVCEEEPLRSALAAAPLLNAPASFLQERLFFMQRLEPASTAYNCPFGVRLRGNLDTNRLESSLAAVIERFAVLRTVFGVVDGDVSQRVLPAGEFRLEREEGSPAADSCADDWLLQAAGQPFDLQHGPLFRARLIELAPQEHILVVCVHHAVFDGASIAHLVTALGHFYSSGKSADADLAPAPMFTNYAQWQRRQWERGAWASQLAYWQKHLQDAPTLLTMPTDFPRPTLQRFRGETLHFEWPRDLAEKVSLVCRDHHVTPFMVLEALFACILHHYSGQDEVLVGVPIANRHRVDSETLIGPVANTVVIRNSFSPRMSWSRLLRQIREATLDAHANQDVPFEKVVEAVQPVRSLAHSPLFQAMMVMQNAAAPTLSLPEVACETLLHRSHASKFDLTLSWFERNGGLAGQIEYDSDLFTRASIEGLLRSLRHVAETCLAAPETPIDQLDLVGARPANVPVPAVDGSDTEATLASLFEAQVMQRPDAIAVTLDGAALTYRQLDDLASALAIQLLDRGAEPDRPVAVLTDRSFEMVVALLAVIKAGCAYMPVDWGTPRERLHRIWSRAGCPLLVTDRTVADCGIDSGRCIPYRVSALHAAVKPVRTQIPPDSLAYVIHTSGSTGDPKGVMISHRGIVNRLRWMQRELQLMTADTVLQKTPFTFDVSVWEIFWPLIQGARLVLAPVGSQKDPVAIERILREESIAFVHFVPSMLSVYLEAQSFSELAALKSVVCSGEALDLAHCERYFEQRPAGRLINLYGPTEASVDVSIWECRPQDRTVPIGRAIDETRLSVLNAAMNEVPSGVIGELHIQGVGLARGYLNDPRATCTAFVPAVLPDRWTGRAYRTGDMSRQRADGAYEFFGRRDGQVKLRGLRIELGEVEQTLKRCAHVTDAAVVVAGDRAQTMQLIGYLTTHSTDLRVEDLKRELAARLPDHMVPSHLVRVDELPRLSSGKVNRGALARLPIPVADADEDEEALATPSPTDLRLAVIWRQFLGVPRVSARTGFFEAGGHSLMAISLLNALNREFGIDMPLQVFLESRSFAELSKRIDTLQWLAEPRYAAQGAGMAEGRL